MFRLWTVLVMILSNSFDFRHPVLKHASQSVRWHAFRPFHSLLVQRFTRAQTLPSRVSAALLFEPIATGTAIGGAIAMGKGLLFACCADECSSQVSGQFLYCMKRTSMLGGGDPIGPYATQVGYSTLLNCGPTTSSGSGTITFQDDIASQRSSTQSVPQCNLTRCSTGDEGAEIHAMAGPSSWQCNLTPFADCTLLKAKRFMS